MVFQAKFIPAILIFIVSMFFVKPVFCQVETNTDSSLMMKRYELPFEGVSIIPPAYFMPLEQEGAFSFVHTGALSSIQVKVIENKPYTYIAPSITNESMQQQGVTLIYQEEVVTVRGDKGILYVLSFKLKSPEQQKDIEFERVMLLTGDYQKTVWIDANYPVQAKNFLFNVIMESILSIEF